jgi:hypothetical protein
MNYKHKRTLIKGVFIYLTLWILLLSFYLTDKLESKLYSFMEEALYILLLVFFSIMVFLKDSEEQKK